MSPISELIVVSTCVYAIVLLVVVFVKRPPFVVWSVWLYRLLLAVYPAPFREEYGPAMVQVFRDTARAEHRRRGLWGLLVVWLWTLVDFGVSIVRQHREQTRETSETSSEVVLLLDLVRRWCQFGCAGVSVTFLSLWYALLFLRLLSRRTVLVCTALTVLILGVWTWSFYESIRMLRYGKGSNCLVLWNGSIEVYHVHHKSDVIPESRWREAVNEKIKEDPWYAERLRPKPTPWEFSFQSEFPMGWYAGTGADGTRFILPLKYWRLRFPFLLLLVIPLCWAIRAHFRGHPSSGAALQSA